MSFVRGADGATSPLLTVAGWTFGAASAAGAVVAAVSDNLDTGLITGGAAGLLAFLFRAWFKENKRNTDETWNHADEYRIERDYYRLESQHWQTRWVALVQGHDAAGTVPPLPKLDEMKAEARREKETSSGRRR